MCLHSGTMGSCSIRRIMIHWCWSSIRDTSDSSTTSPSTLPLLSDTHTHTHTHTHTPTHTHTHTHTSNASRHLLKHRSVWIQKPMSLLRSEEHTSALQSHLT